MAAQSFDSVERNYITISLYLQHLKHKISNANRIFIKIEINQHLIIVRKHIRFLACH